MLVQRLDETDGYYFIVPFSISSRVTARIAVDWRTNRVVEVAGVDTSDKALPSWSDPRQLVLRAASETSWIPWLRFRVHPDLVVHHPTLVWRSCRESRSMLRPFHLLTIGDTLVYVRVDGAAFPGLSTGPDA